MGLKEACGVFAIYGHPEAARITYLGLYGLQHRGQESAGICSSDGDTLYLEKGIFYFYSTSITCHARNS